MQSPHKTEEGHKAFGNERLERHMTWKREFFQSRPPPPPIGRLHRRQSGHKGGAPLRATFRRACEIASQQSSCGIKPPTHSAQATQGHVAELSEPTPHKRWIQQMRKERDRRSPFTDLKIFSNAEKTVIMANLHQDTIEEDVRRFGDQFGRVVQVRIVRHHETGQSRRYAFVEYGLIAEAKRAVSYSRKRRLKGRCIIIDIERGRSEVGFLPKRLAEAARHEHNSTSVGEEPAPKVLKTSHADSKSSIRRGDTNECDDDDAFLNAILRS